MWADLSAPLSLYALAAGVSGLVVGFLGFRLLGGSPSALRLAIVVQSGGVVGEDMSGMGSMDEVAVRAV